ncbi:MAG: YebC/PmpR family DNA-binding transcriptional regulator, partial [candidate division WOR-3 bacterium]|nr:YebC/PmpR family DNA-binding transcriptional regulator [candidate division WOR-3 bacterium]
KTFSKVTKEIMLAAREGGGDPEMNARLRNAIEHAKEVNMPQDNVDRAIKKGTGELEGTRIEEAYYEGYGPGGVALLVEVATDNKNRTASEIKHIFSKYNGSMGSIGSVTWMFDRKGIIDIEKGKYDFDKIMDIAIENGAEDVINEEETVEIITSDHDFSAVKNALNDAGIEMVRAEITKIPQSTKKLDESTASSLFKLIDRLDESDDVQNVYANYDIDDEILEKLAE